MTAESTKKPTRAEAIGKPAFEAIAEMVKAADLDWDRLEELRDERDQHCPEDDADGLGPVTWEEVFEADADELAELEKDAGDCDDAEEAETRIHQDPLSIEVGGWWACGQDPEATEYRILLATGGPAVRICGDLGEHGEAATATLQVQDWFKPWTEYRCDQDTLLAYVAKLYLGE